MSNPHYNCDPSSDQFGVKFNDRLGNVGHQYNYHNGQVLDPYRLELDFFVYDNERLDYNPCYSDNPPLIRSVLSPLTDIVGHSNTGYSDRYCSGQILDSYRLESDLPAGGQNGIDMSKSMGQLLESLEDLNQNIRSGFNIMAVCTDYGRQTMHDHMSVHDDILSRLEQSLFTSKPYIEKTQADSLELRRNQDRVYSDLNLQEKTVSNLNQELVVLSEKT